MRELREDKKMTQKDLAKKICVTIGTISNYENDQHFPDVEKLVMIADCFDVTIDYLLGRTVSHCSPDIFQRMVAPGITVATFLEDFQKIPIAIGKPLILSLVFPPLHTERATFTALRVPSTITSSNLINLPLENFPNIYAMLSSPAFCRNSLSFFIWLTFKLQISL